MIKVIGLQRSGTNWLTELLDLNFDEKVFKEPMDPFFKHSLPYDDVVLLNSGKMVRQEQPRDVDCKKILIYKPVDKWLESIEKNPADLKYKKPGVFEGGLEEYWINFNHGWFDLVDYVVDYSDLLWDFEKELGSIKSELGLTRVDLPFGFTNVGKVPQSKEFTEKDRERYFETL